MQRKNQAFAHAIDMLAEHYKKQNIDYIAEIEARGFIFGSALAYKMGKGFIPIRKPGKRVLIVDDLLATGGTAEAAIKLVKKLAE